MVPTFQINIAACIPFGKDYNSRGFKQTLLHFASQEMWQHMPISVAMTMAVSRQPSVTNGPMWQAMVDYVCCIHALGNVLFFEIFDDNIKKRVTVILSL